ncbi:MAG: hypothetical protein JNN30_20125 [Rhodanobacteraceae bacterium]|nr:hypothetical protein [Rhodanobacteraceae bacterium]
MGPFLKFCIGIVGTFSVLLIGFVFLALLSGKRDEIEDLLKTLPERELATLEAICKAEGMEAKQLRPLGITTDALLRDSRNARVVVIRDGHVRSLSLRGTKTPELHDLSALTELETLWLEKGRLTTWPKLDKLTKLRDVQLNDQPLDSPAPNYLPTSLGRLGLAGTKVTSIDALTGFAFDEVDLSRTPIAKLPDHVPVKGAWRLTLDDTLITKPVGYELALPPGVTVSGPTLTDGKIEGMASHKRVDVTITGSALRTRATIALPTNSSAHPTSGPVEIECSVASGAMRVWLQEPEGMFQGEWFTRGRIKGFGFARATGYFSTEISADRPGKALGTLIVQGAPPRFSFAVVVEPIGDAPVTGIQMHVRTAP